MKKPLLRQPLEAIEGIMSLDIPHGCCLMKRQVPHLLLSQSPPRRKPCNASLWKAVVDAWTSYHGHIPAGSYSTISCYCWLPNAMRTQQHLLVESLLDLSRHYSDTPLVLFTSPLILAHEDSKTACTSYQKSSSDRGNGEFKEVKDIYSQT